MQPAAQTSTAFVYSTQPVCRKGRGDGVEGDAISPRPWGRLEARSQPFRQKLGQEAVGPPSTPSTRWFAVVGAASR